MRLTGGTNLMAISSGFTAKQLKLKARIIKWFSNMSETLCNYILNNFFSMRFKLTR